MFGSHLETRRAQILAEMEEHKERLMREMSGVDKETLKRLRDLMSDYYTARANLALQAEGVEKLTADGLIAYRKELDELNRRFVNDIDTVVMSRDIAAKVNTLVGEQVANHIDNIVQTTGNGTGVVMSQKATTDELFKLNDLIMDVNFYDVAKNVTYSEGKYYLDGGGMSVQHPDYPQSYIETYERVKPNTIYTCAKYMQVCFYNRNYEYVGFVSTGGNDTFTTPDECAYIRWSITTSSLPVKINAIHILKNPIISTSGTLNSGGNMSLAVPNVKNGNVLSFRGKISSFSSLKFSHGKTNAYASAWLIVDGDTIKVYQITEGERLVETLYHGLTIDTFININLIVGNNFDGELVLSTRTGTFKAPIDWKYGCHGDFVVESYGTVLTDCRMKFYANSYNKDVWMFGDSYFDMWCPYAVQYGANNVMFDAHSGRGSRDAFNSMLLALSLGTPKTIVWCLGMNEGDSGAVNATWLHYFKEIKRVCKENNIELIFSTIPNTPTITNTYKNQVIIDSGYRYINIADSVGAFLGNAWHSGMLSGDNVHPTSIGCQTIANYVISELPQIIA